MIVEDRRFIDTHVELKNVAVGEVIQVDNDIFIVTDVAINDFIRCIDLKQGSHVVLPKSTRVELRNAKLILE